MAKRKRKSTRRSTKRTKKEAPVEYELPGGFWRQIIAILMIAAALFCVVTWFGQGGTVLNTIHSFAYKGLGFGTYFIPILLVYLAIKKLRADDNRLAVPVYFAGLFMILWISGIAAIWKSGGLVGAWLNSLALNFLSQGVVIFIYIILIFITTAFLLQLSPVTFFKGTKNLVKTGKASTQAEEKTNKKLGQLEIKVNSGVGPVDIEPKNQPTPKLPLRQNRSKPKKRP